MSDQRLRSYPSIYHLGHPALAMLLYGTVVVQEKVDGSQFTFGHRDGELFCRSKGKQLVVDEPEQMFVEAVAVVKSLHAAGLIVDGRTYRCEYLRTPHHNTLRYNRIPANHLVLFDVDYGYDNYMSPELVAEIAQELGLEPVATFHYGAVHSLDEFQALLDRESALGGPKIEGVVVKSYTQFGKDKRPLLGKYVRPEFKELNAQQWKVTNPSAGDVITSIIHTYKTDTRWTKAVQHLRDAGALEGSPRDIAGLIKEVPADVLKECREEIEAALWKWAWPKIERGLRAGLPEWYKQQLAESQFANVEA